MNEPVAIIGSSCRFPGATSPTKLWDLLRQPRDVLSEIPAERFNNKAFFHHDGSHHGTSNVSQCYLLQDDPCTFDAAFFNVHNREAEAIDPQQRLLLESVYESIESAGSPYEYLKGTRTGVFVGLMCGDYYDVQLRDPESLPQYFCTGTARNNTSNRVSYFFDWTGPSLTVDTACSSSLVAVHLAVQALRNNECETAVAAGVNLIFGPEMFIGESKLGMLSPSGKSKMWSANADGYARGEGCASVVLKLLCDAIRDGDHIESIIRETGVNSDGRTKGITMPSAKSQENLIRQTYGKAGLDASKSTDSRCQYFEAHGTGTLAGDPIEAEAISRAFFSPPTCHDTEETLFVGSIKTVIGHLEGAAGIAGLLKASLAIQNGSIPANMHFDRLNPAIEPFYHHLRVPVDCEAWPEVPDGVPRRASVNSFGFGGTNAHLILEGYQPTSRDTTSKVLPNQDADKQVIPLMFSATSDYSLGRIVETFSQYIREHEINLNDLSWTLCSKRSLFDVRISIPCGSRETVLEQMERKLSDVDKTKPTPFGIHLNTSEQASNQVLGVFTGQGAQWATMGSQLLKKSSVFANTIRDLDQTLQDLPDSPEWLLESELLAKPSTSRMNQAVISQPCCTAIQIALVDLLKVSGVKLSAVIGHSSGEIAAAYASGVVSARDAIVIAYYRGFHNHLAIGKNGATGSMLAIGLGFEKSSAFCAKSQFQGRLHIAALNAPHSTTLAGDREAILQAHALLQNQGTFARVLAVDTAYHSPHMQPCAASYLHSLEERNIKYHTGRHDCTWISSLHGFEMDISSDPVTDQYWIDNLLSPVLFTYAVGQAFSEHGKFAAILEIGPHPALKGPTTQCIQEFGDALIPHYGVLSRGEDDVVAFSSALGSLWTSLPTPTIDFESFAATIMTEQSQPLRACSGLPPYPWDHRQRFWRESRVSKAYRSRSDVDCNELLGVPIDSMKSELRWRNILRLNEIPWVKHHKFQGAVLFPAAGYCAMALEASKALWRGQIVRLIELHDFDIKRGLTLEEDTSGVEILFCLSQIKESQNDNTTKEFSIQAEISCSACNIDGMNQMSTIFEGKLRISIGQESLQSLPSRSGEVPSLRPVDVERFYTCMSEIGLEYSGPFRNISTARRRMYEAFATASKLESSYLIHPALLDLCFQSIFLGYFSPGDGSLPGPFLPRSIKKLKFNPITSMRDTKVNIESFVTDFVLPTTKAVASIVGDVDMFDDEGHNKQLQVEGLTCIALPQSDLSEDRKLFYQNVWIEDISSGLKFCNDGLSISAQESCLLESCERLALSYYHGLRDLFTETEVTNKNSNLLQRVNQLWNMIETGSFQPPKLEWANMPLADVESNFLQNNFSSDIASIKNLGESLQNFVRGDQISGNNNMVENLYGGSVDSAVINKHVTEAVGQIAHRYPRMNVLTIGTDTGQISKEVLSCLGSVFASYVHTDTSSHHLQTAREHLLPWMNIVKLEIFDIRNEGQHQNLRDSSFDLIIAPNILQSTSHPENMLLDLRRLLKLGGFLISTEINDESLRGRLILDFMQTLYPSFGYDTSPESDKLSVLSREGEDFFRRNGFSSIHSNTPHILENTKCIFTLRITQATDPWFDILIKPSLCSELEGSSDNILIIGGSTPSAWSLVSEMQSLLRDWTGKVEAVSSIENIDWSQISTTSVVLSVIELDNPFFQCVDSRKFDALKNLFHQVRKVFWVTCGCGSDNPHSNMTVGIGRSVISESPHLRLQFFDIDSASQLNAKLIADTFLRFVHATASTKREEELLWTLEPELKYSGGKLLIPRVLPIQGMNDRLASRYKSIIRETPEAYKTLIGSRKGDFEYIRVRYASRYAIRVTKNVFLHICVGFLINDSSQCVIALCGNCDPIICVPRFCTFRCNIPSTIEESVLPVMISNLVAQNIIDMEPLGEIVIFTDDGYLSDSLSIQLSEMKPRVTVLVEASCTSINPSVIPVHPEMSNRAASLKVPCTTSSIFDLTRRLDTRSPFLADLPTTQNYYLGSDFFRPSANTAATNNDDANMELFQSILQKLSKIEFLAPKQTAIYSIHNKDFNISIRYPLLALLTLPKTVLPIEVKPLDIGNLFDCNRTYLLVGLTGDLGQSLCRWMVKQGARYLVVSSRSPSIEDKWEREIKLLGAKIIVKSMDVTDLKSVLDLRNSLLDYWPPLAGIANAAMVLSDSPFNTMTYENFYVVTKPKVEGSLNLHKVFEDCHLDFFIMFSSLACVTGNPGQSNYSAANMFMASLAAQRRSNGLAASVIDIGMIVGTGILVRKERSIEDSLRRQGFTAISEPEFHQIFAEAVLSGQAGSSDPSEIITGLQNSIGDIKPTWIDNPRFSHHHLAAKPGKATQVSTSAGSLRDQLAAHGEPAAVEETLRKAFLAQLETTLRLPPHAINGERSLVELGIDSLMAVEIRSWWLRELDFNFSVLKLLDGASPFLLCSEVTSSIFASKLVHWGGKGESSDITSNSEDPSLIPGFTDTSQPTTIEITGPKSGGESTNVDTQPAPVSIDQFPENFEHTDLLSSAQSGIWFLMGCIDDPTIYNCTLRYRVSGRIDVARLKDAFTNVATRHESLRTAYFRDPITKDVKQGVLRSPRLDWLHQTVTAEEDVILAFSTMKKKVFEIRTGRTIAITLLTRTAYDHDLILGYHHLIMDGISLQIFLQDILASYEQPTMLPKIYKQYIDFSRQQRSFLKSSTSNEDKAYYLSEFTNPPALPLFPFAKSPMRRILPKYRIYTRHRRLDASLTALLKKLCSSLKSTPFHFHMSNLQLLLNRTLGVQDVCIGIGNANRVDEDFEKTVGLLLDFVPVRLQMEPYETFAQMIRSTRKKIIRALHYGRTPYHTFLPGSEDSKKSTLSPLFQIVLNYLARAPHELKLGDSTLIYEDSEEAKHTQDLVFTIREDPDGTTLISVAAHDYLYDSVDVEGVLGIYFTLLESVVNDTSLPISDYTVFKTSTGRPRVSRQGVAATAGWPDTLAKRVSEVAHLNMESLALKDQRGSSLTYKQMTSRINTIAVLLHQLGVSSGSFVAVAGSPSTDTVCAILAIWNRGAAYVPLEMSHSVGRLSSIMSDCKPVVIVCSDSSQVATVKSLGINSILDLSSTPTRLDFQMPDQSTGPEVAVLMYTSGSTGTPKGVLLTHANILCHAFAIQTELGLSQEVVLQQSSMGFDASLFQIFMALSNGGTLIMTTGQSNPGDLSRIIMRENVSVTLAVPTEYHLWLDSKAGYLQKCNSWRLAISGGEKLTATLVKGFRALNLSGLRLFNAYGPTESSICCSVGEVSYLMDDPESEWKCSVIGKPLPGYEVYVLDEKLQQKPIGWPGEIFIAGDGVGAGYLNREKETQKHFLQNPFGRDGNGESYQGLLYRTGDEGQMLADGSINFIGRVEGDNQVKLRGIRIELDEVANVVTRASRGVIKQTVVIKKGQTHHFLLAFVIFAIEPADSATYLQELLRALPLPASMQPATAVALEHIPMNSNGKINIEELQKVPLFHQDQQSEDPGLTFVEKKLVEIWQEVLPETTQGLTINKETDFFAIGGNSLLLLKIQTLIQEISGFRIPLPKLFQETTLREMALQVVLDASASQNQLSLDWERETSMDQSEFQFGSDLNLSRGTKNFAETVILTGSSGFLGRRILDLLLKSDQIKRIYCIAVRPGSKSRLPSSPKIEIYTGDLADSHLGLDTKTLAAIITQADAIIHNGADVSFLKPYAKLRVPNVLATKFLCNIAAPRGIPIHYISSAGVTRLAKLPSYPEVSIAAYPPSSYPATDVHALGENLPFEGYISSKWASEVILERTNLVNHTPIRIYRPSAIIGLGAPKLDLLANILEFSKQLRAVPSLSNWTGVFDLISVDRVSEIIVHCVLSARPLSSENEMADISFKHVCGEWRFDAAGLREFVQTELALESCVKDGEELPEINELSFDEWIASAKDVGMEPLLVEFFRGLAMSGNGVVLPVLEKGCKDST
ncbi:polyketide synthase [Tricladium varicosporioides]|nr:polyketide synthase [Hymenoscyphus varicosporioides]